ncbi:MAG: hypothetical protein RLN88_14570 [Ekhidna sp.]|uniref:hypothetical protein n=1 Tax=Ekhidna sp. TaxID=2608089 RepID=UPI0032F02532
MKKKRNTRYAILGLLLIGMSQGFAQELQPLSANFPDTLTLQTDVGNKVTFAFNRMSRKRVYFNNDLWKSTVSVMETAVRNSDLNPGLQVTYRKVAQPDGEVAKVEVKPLKEANDVYLIGKDGMIQRKADRTEFQLLFDQVVVSFFVSDLSELEEVKALDIQSVWSQIDMKFEDEGKRNQYLGDGKFRYGKAQVDQLRAKELGHDHIEITFVGIGLGYYRDRFVPDIGSRVSFRLQDRLGNDWMEFGVLYTQQYFFSRDEANKYQSDLNGWITGFWKMNTGKNNEMGIGIGGLIHRDGGYFEGSTWKLSLYNKGSNSKVTFSPELIFTNDFEKMFPALRLGLSF